MIFSLLEALLAEVTDEDWRKHVAMFLHRKNGKEPNLSIPKYAQQADLDKMEFMRALRAHRADVEKELAKPLKSVISDPAALAKELGQALQGTKKEKKKRIKLRHKKSKKGEGGDPVAQLMALLKADGAVELRSKKHRVFKLSNGKRFTMGSTVSDYRAARNLLAELKKLLGQNSGEGKVESVRAIDLLLTQLTDLLD